jgi:hypothetical protein
MDWSEVNDEQKFYIFKFDDGIKYFETVFPNTWYITARCKEKVRLKNTVSGLIIPSISEWKISKYFT